MLSEEKVAMIHDNFGIGVCFVMLGILFGYETAGADAVFWGSVLVGIVIQASTSQAMTRMRDFALVAGELWSVAMFELIALIVLLYGLVMPKRAN
jgi:hypothetical protein